MTQECVQVDFECLQRGGQRDLHGQPFPVLCQPQCKDLPHVEVEFPVF